MIDPWMLVSIGLAGILAGIGLMRLGRKRPEDSPARLPTLDEVRERRTW